MVLSWCLPRFTAPWEENATAVRGNRYCVAEEYRTKTFEVDVDVSASYLISQRWSTISGMIGGSAWLPSIWKRIKPKNGG
jgi:hypothetical protein